MEHFGENVRILIAVMLIFGVVGCANVIKKSDISDKEIKYADTIIIKHSKKPDNIFKDIMSTLVKSGYIISHSSNGGPFVINTEFKEVEVLGTIWKEAVTINIIEEHSESTIYLSKKIRSDSFDVSDMARNEHGTRYGESWNNLKKEFNSIINSDVKYQIRFETARIL